MAVVLGSGEPEGHGRALLRLLDEQRKEGRFCDVMVQVGRARFAAHRCILAACSPFLCQKLDATSSDATPEVLHLDMLQADAFAAVLQFLYTAQADNKEALANGAHALDVALPVPADPPAMSELESPVSLTPCITAVPSPISPSLCRSRYPYSISERINRVGGANSRYVMILTFVLTARNCKSVVTVSCKVVIPVNYIGASQIVVHLKQMPSMYQQREFSFRRCM
uniref:BTB domain-containing protein n=1 Tax=Eptatretus burgeri TaxID=7764 RepID=A0A8C4QZU2_EPTBU